MGAQAQRRVTKVPEIRRGDPVVQISPPLIATQNEFDQIAGTLGEVLAEAWQKIR